MMDPLSPVEVRVLGALVEKALATPEYYPMSLNALINACNQKTGREPVTEFSEDEVLGALDELMRRRLAGTSSGAGSRVVKYRHTLDHAFDLDAARLAVLAVLMLRGAQTVGEIRSRAGRMHEFESLEEAEATLRLLVDGEDPLVAVLPVRPGRKEPRYAHLLAGEPEVDGVEADAPGQAVSGRRDRLDALEERVGELTSELESLRSEFARFRAQFE